MNEDSHSKLGQLYLRRNVKANISIQSEELLSNQTYESDLAFRNQHRRLQFDGMFETPNNMRVRSRKGGKGRSSENTRSNPNNRVQARQQALNSYVEEILVNMDRYHQWWTGPVQEEMFKPADWSIGHTTSSNAVFTMAVIQGLTDKNACSKPLHDFKLFIGTLRRFYNEDIVIAVESATLTNDPQIKSFLKENKCVVYELSADICSKETNSIFCGSIDERVPASVFRYFFYEKWASHYQQSSLILLSDFRDVIFQADPFGYHIDDWYPDHQLAVYQEFYPNMVINRCNFNRRIMFECFGEEALKTYGRRIIISSGGLIGNRDAILSWSHHMTLLLQDAPGRQVGETRCASGGIEHGFINYLIYGNKLRSLLRIKIFAQGEGTVNSLGGLRPDTVQANITGNLRSFWKILNDDGYILNWSGEVSPVVHQLDHYMDELLSLANQLLDSPSSDLKKSLKTDQEGRVDLSWQALAASRCLWGCVKEV